MILKKPYAFLIKKFRIIHLILVFLVGFVFYRSILINNFFINYIKNNYTSSVLLGLDKTYVPSFLFIIIILIIFLSSSIFYLLKHKNKPSKIYLFLIIYYVFLILYLVYIKGVFSGLSEELLNAKAARTIRDITLIVSSFQIIFLIISFIRTVGFDIKKFDFKSDLKEMNYDFGDAEEVEVNFNINSYKYKRKLRRSFREFIYYIKENKLFVSIFLGICFLTLIIYLISNKTTNYDQRYAMKRSFIYNNMNISIEDAMVTNVNYNGNVINEGKYYVVLNVHLINDSGYTRKIDFNQFNLKTGNKIIKPAPSYSTYFIDFSSPNIANDFAHKTNKYIALTYEIDEKDKNNSFSLDIYNGSVYSKNKEVTKHIYVKLRCSKKFDVSLNKNYSLGEKIVLDDTYLGSSTVKFDSFEINKSYFYTYEKCIKEVCDVYDDVIVPKRINNYVLTLYVKGNMDNETLYGKSYSNLSQFAENFMSIEYKIDNKTYKSASNLSLNGNNNFVAFEVDKNILNADFIQAVITIRNQKYVVNLKS